MQETLFSLFVSQDNKKKQKCLVYIFPLLFLFDFMECQIKYHKKWLLQYYMIQYLLPYDVPFETKIYNISTDIIYSFNISFIIYVFIFRYSYAFYRLFIPPSSPPPTNSKNTGEKNIEYFFLSKLKFLYLFYFVFKKVFLYFSLEPYFIFYKMKFS